MKIYHIIMLCLLALSLIITPIITLIRNQLPQYTPGIWNLSRLPDSRMKQIYKTCRS